MSILKRVPWVSLALVMLSYSSLGWVISETRAPLFVWLATVVAILLFNSNVDHSLAKNNILFECFA